MALVRAPLASITECTIDEELVSTLQPHTNNFKTNTLKKNPPPIPEIAPSPPLPPPSQPIAHVNPTTNEKEI